MNTYTVDPHDSRYGERLSGTDFMIMIQRALRVLHCLCLSQPSRQFHYNVVRFSKGYDDEKLRKIIESSSMSPIKLEKLQTINKTDQPKDSLDKLKPNVANDSNFVEVILLIGDSPKLLNQVASHTTNKDDQRNSPLQAFAYARENYKRFMKSVLADSQQSLAKLAAGLNQITGYTKIEEHKTSVRQLEQDVKAARIAVKKAKKQYTDAIDRRSALQREVNELLTNKNNWSPIDVERFTELYKSDHENHNNEIESKHDLESAEQHLDSIQLQLGTKILTRYHEEQLWSDKIRQALTWGTWMLTGVNILLFVVATFLVEPWKRRRLVKAFHKEVEQQFDEYTEEIHHLSSKIAEISGKVNAENSLDGMISKDATPHVLTVKNFGSWTSLKTSFNQLIQAFSMPGSSFVISKSDLAIISGSMVAICCGLASLVTYALFT